MEVRYDKAALQEYMDQVGTVGEQMRRRQDESLNVFNSCKQQYNRIHTKLEEVAHRAYNQLENAESMQRSAELEYETARRTAENAEDEDERNSAMRRMQQAQMMRASAEEEYSKASIAYSKATGDLRSLSELWDENAPALESQAHLVEDGMASFSRLVENGNSDLGEYMSIMDKAQSALYGGSTGESSGSTNTTSSSSNATGLTGTQSTSSGGSRKTASSSFQSKLGNTIGIVAAANKTDAPKVLKKSPQQIWDEGSRYIDNILEVYRDELRDKGVVDDLILEAAIAEYQQQYLQVLSSDHANRTFHLYDHDVPNFKELAAQLNEKDLRHIEASLRNNFGASVVQLDGFDVRVAHDMADALNDAKRDFPALKISYFGSCQSQAASMRSDLTEYYKDYFKDCKQYWTDEQYEAAVKYNVERYVHDYLELDDTDGTIAWSLNVGNSDPTVGELGKYSGVAVNLDFASSYDDFKRSKVQNVQDRFKPIGCETPRATMDHELGHEIDRLVGAAQDPQTQKWYHEMLQSNNAASVLSEYSKTTIYEFIAEGYSEYRNNPKPREYSAKIFNRLIELRNQKAGGCL